MAVLTSFENVIQEDYVQRQAVDPYKNLENCEYIQKSSNNLHTKTSTAFSKWC